MSGAGVFLGAFLGCLGVAAAFLSAHHWSELRAALSPRTAWAELGLSLGNAAMSVLFLGAACALLAWSL